MIQYKTRADGGLVPKGSQKSPQQLELLLPLCSLHLLDQHCSPGIHLIQSS